MKNTNKSRRSRAAANKTQWTGENRQETDAAAAGGNSGPSASTSTGTSGTKVVRPRVDAEQWAMVVAEAYRRRVTPGDLLADLIGRIKSGCKRGAGARTLQLKAIEVLLGKVTLSLIRYEGALQDFVGRPSSGQGLAEAEAEDHRDALARLVLDANARLRSDLAQLRALLNKTIQAKGGQNDR